jgi:DNA-binding helix-hairpin-helix protein with protein kinase domain
MVFQILMRSMHPFNIVGGEGPAENIRKGVFPYGSNQCRLVPKGDWILLWSHLPKRMKDMFNRAFVCGVRKPSERPDLEEWIDVLMAYLSDARKGWHDLSLRPAGLKS